MCRGLCCRIIGIRKSIFQRDVQPTATREFDVAIVVRDAYRAERYVNEFKMSVEGMSNGVGGIQNRIIGAGSANRDEDRFHDRTFRLKGADIYELRLRLALMQVKGASGAIPEDCIKRLAQIGKTIRLAEQFEVAQVLGTNKVFRIS